MIQILGFAIRQLRFFWASFSNSLTFIFNRSIKVSQDVIFIVVSQPFTAGKLEISSIKSVSIEKATEQKAH